jgi:glycosyltransferase involved in cell wall biosynthesis
MFIGCESFPNNVNAKYIINWSHRPYVKDAVSFTVNKIVVPSEWSKQFLNDSRVVVIPNGIEDIYFGNKTPKIPHRIIYAGYVGKGGMAVLPRIFDKVKEQFSDAEMIVCGGAKLWGNDDTKFKDIYDSLEKSGIKYIGQIGNIELSNLLQSSSILINPVGSHHKETFGLVVGQAMACGCYPISSGEGNLDNLIGSDGRCIYGEINSDEWINLAVKSITSVFNDKNFKDLSDSCISRVKSYNWHTTAKQFEQLCLK